MIKEFLKGFAARKPIKVGDLCREKSTGLHSVCLNIYQGMYYGKTTDNKVTMGLIENFERVI